MAKSKFNKEKIITGLCIWLSEGKTLRSFCREDGTPAYTNIYQWMNDSEAFASRIAHARSIGYDSIAEECFEIADNTKMGTKVKESEDGIEVTKEDMLGHRKLQIHTRMQLLSKWNPKKYGDKLQHSGDAENPIKLTISREDSEF